MRIIYTYDITAISGVGVAAIVTLMVAFFAGFLVTLWGVAAEDDLRIKIKNAVYAIVFAAVLAILYYHSIGPGGPKDMRYKATVDEAYTAREMNERYVVLSVEGELYTLKDKE